MKVLLSLFFLWCITPGQPLSYPVFGTKRYHRAVGSSYLPTSYASSPYYNSQQYYEQRQPQYYSPNYEQQAYVNENGYYYYPRHEYHSYGMPTYHGEYKPSPYYYAPGPSYSYYDDRDVPSNPLDDLHEEMLQEDERERQRDLVPVGQESWYENSRQQEDLTNNFLRNLIAYNRQVDAQRHQQQQQPHHEMQNIQQDPPAEYEDYGDMPAEYEYDPQDESYVDMRRYENPHQHHQNDNSKFIEVEDENERQLKSLARERQLPPSGHHAEEIVHDEDSYNNWQHPSSSYASYDADPEYDDSWISWDRKRSGRPERVSAKRDESITDFNDRKIFPFMKQAGKIESTIKPVISSTTSTMAPKPSVSSAATTSQSKSTNEQVGQKEIVLLRPSNPAQHIFNPPALDVIGNAIRNGKQESDEVEDEESKRGNSNSAKSGNVYDTIKELIAMQEQLGHSMKGSYQKRFVSNEESLVHELDNLKRRSQ